jgi:hypothetical protein
MLLWKTKTPEVGHQQKRNINERRGGRRKRQRLVAAKVEWATMLYARPCKIMNMSLTGACIALDDDDIKASRVPEKFVLRILPDKAKITCNVVWRKGRTLGLKFSGPLKRLD